MKRDWLRRRTSATGWPSGQTPQRKRRGVERYLTAPHAEENLQSGARTKRSQFRFVTRLRADAWRETIGAVNQSQIDGICRLSRLFRQRRVMSTAALHARMRRPVRRSVRRTAWPSRIHRLTARRFGRRKLRQLARLQHAARPWRQSQDKTRGNRKQLLAEEIHGM